MVEAINLSYCVCGVEDEDGVSGYEGDGGGMIVMVLMVGLVIQFVLFLFIVEHLEKQVQLRVEGLLQSQ
jgi:hypothetical protein